MTLDQFIGWLVLAATDLEGSGLTELGESRRRLLAQLAAVEEVEALRSRALAALLPLALVAAGVRAVSELRLLALPR